MSESAFEVEGRCEECRKAWPAVKFSNGAGFKQIEGRVQSSLICDACLASESREGQIAEKIDEAQATDGEPLLIRQVMVTGVKSGTNVVSFRYPTHVRLNALTITDVLVTFKNGQDYLYKNVPVAVCEAWHAAPSKGEYFVEQIKNSYPYEKVK